MQLPKKIPSPYSFYEKRENLFLEMGIGENGIKYEKKIYKFLLKASEKNKNIIDVSKPTGNNCHKPDITVSWKDYKINFEIKSKFDDPLGNFSLKYELGSKDFDLSNDSLNHSDKDNLSSIFQNKLNDIDRYIKFARRQSPTSYNKKINKFPMYISKEGAEAARKKGLAKAIADYATKDEFDIKTVFGLYNNGKNTYYIQIGGYGLYCLGFDKYKLGVPLLEGKCIVEIRPFSSGVKERRDPETGKIINVVSLGLRASPRMTRIENESPYSLENVETIDKIFR